MGARKKEELIYSRLSHNLTTLAIKQIQSMQKSMKQRLLRIPISLRHCNEKEQ